jgi:cytochrome c553
LLHDFHNCLSFVVSEKEVRAMKRALKWIGRILAGLLAILVVAFVILTFIGSARANKTYDVQAENINISAGEAAIARGRHIAEAISLCQGCHGENLEGQLLEDQQPVFTLAAPNLTTGEGGVGSDLTDADFVRAIRHGLDPESHPLMIMHSDYYHNLSEQDLASVIAYIKSVPPVDNEVPETKPGFLGRVMLPLGAFDDMPSPLFPAEEIDHDAAFASAPPQGTTAEYGEYLVSVALCQMCHGSDLTGGPPMLPEDPPGPNLQLHALDGGWSAEEFISTIRTGVTPLGRALNPDAMPWEFYGKMTDDELGAIWAYIGSLSGN